MIELSGITKRYGATLALDRVTLTIQPGDVVGLLGPNGAGKSTMMRILTGYIPASAGQAKVAGLDVADDSLAVRRRIGYLPESNPLYDDFAVLESLDWTARLRGVADAARSGAIRQAVRACGLESVVHRDVGELSKGFRQRVGLAQAILHDPDILILDEPTSGLDPNQQQEVRDLIARLREKKTVIISTHILPEAQSACNRVLIIHKGRLVADGAPQELGDSSRRGGRLVLEWRAPEAAGQQALERLPGVTRVTIEERHADRLRLSLETDATDIREPLFYLAAERRWPILQLTPQSASLEDVFRELTAS